MDSETSRSEQAEEAAARWFARQQSDAWTEADQARFEAWLQAATANRIEYIRVTAAWEQCARMKALGAGVPAGEIPPRGSWGDARFLVGSVAAESAVAKGTAVEHEGVAPRVDHPRGRTLSRRRMFATAALVACIAVVTYLFDADLFAGGARYSTAVGEIRNVPLADGSMVTLNTDTSIRVALTDHERHIQLQKGEAFFDVAKDKTRPFIVYAGEKRVMAVGTKFSVRRERDDIQVVVTEGRVNLAASADQPLISPAASSGTAAGTAPSSANSIPPPTFLAAGAIARTQNSEVLVRPDAAREAEKLLSWRRGYIYFDNVALADAVAEFNRYNTRKIFIEDPRIAAIRVGGNFHSTNIDAFLDLIQSGFPIVVEQDGERVTLKGR